MRLKVEEIKNYIERFLALLVEIKNAISSTVASYFPTPVSDEWNSSTLYHKGDYCILNNYLYKCLADNSNVRPPNTTYWILTNCGNEFNALNNNLKIDTYRIATGRNLIKYGKVVIFNITSWCSPTELKSIIIPEGYRPATVIDIPFASNGYPNNGYVEILTNGTIDCTISNSILCNAVWITL